MNTLLRFRSLLAAGLARTALACEGSIPSATEPQPGVTADAPDRARLRTELADARGATAVYQDVVAALADLMDNPDGLFKPFDTRVP